MFFSGEAFEKQEIMVKSKLTLHWIFEKQFDLRFHWSQWFVSEIVLRHFPSLFPQKKHLNKHETKEKSQSCSPLNLYEKYWNLIFIYWSQTLISDHIVRHIKTVSNFLYWIFETYWSSYRGLIDCECWYLSTFEAKSFSQVKHLRSRRPKQSFEFALHGIFEKYWSSYWDLIEYRCWNLRPF